MCEDLVEELGEHTGCLHARRVLGWFSKGMADAARFRDRAHQVSTLDEVRDLVGSYSRELAE
jgi:tRNA-dihydrouridine synthase